QRRLERIAERRLRKGFASVLIERRLGIKGFQVAVPAGQEDPDDRLRLRPMMWRAGSVSDRSRAQAVTVQHGPERKASEAHAEVGEEGAAMDLSAAGAWRGGSHGTRSVRARNYLPLYSGDRWSTSENGP